MQNIAVIFPGQAHMKPGAGQSLITQLPLVGSTVAQTSEVVGRDLEELCFQGNEEQLNTAASVHSLLFAFSLGVYRALRERGVIAGILGGFSLGEYSAFCASGAVSLPDSACLVEERSKLISTNKDGAMARVKEGVERVRQICDQIGGVDVSAIVAPAITNITGIRDTVELAVKACQEEGINARLIPVPTLSHHKSLVGIATIFRMTYLDKVPLLDIEVPIVNATVARVVRNFPGVFRRCLAEQLARPVDWLGSVRVMRRQGVDTFVEVGAVSHLIKSLGSIVPEARVFKVTDAESFQQTVAALTNDRASP